MKDSNNNDLLDNNLDLGLIIRLLLMQSKLIVFIVFLATALGITYYLFTPKIYKVSSLVQVYSSQNMGFGQSLDLFVGDQNTSDLRNVDEIYQSRSVLVQVIDEKLHNIAIEDISYEEKKKLINIFKVKDLAQGKTKRYVIKFNEDSYEIQDVQTEIKETFPYGFDNNFDNLVTNINYIPNFNGTEININFSKPEDVYRSFKGRYNLNSSALTRALYSQKNGLINISYISSDLEEAVETLDFTNKLFLKENIKTESEQARKAINFIDQRVFAVKNELDEYKEDLKSFKELNQSIDVDREAEAIIDSLERVEVEINSTDLEISKASSNYTASNPIFQNLLNRRNILEEQKTIIENRIRNLPLAQQEYIDLFRTVEITERAYSELVNRKLEFSIKEASTLGNIRIVDDAYYESIVSPRLSVVLYAFFSSLIISLLFALFRGLFFLPISNPAELLDNRITVPVKGVVNKLEDDESLETEKFKNAIENLVVNLGVQQTNKNSILFTSPTAENGKSFISRSFAMKVSSLGKKVVLLDFDFKRGDQHKVFGTDKIESKEFLNLNSETIGNYKVNENLFFIPKITRLDNSFQFLHSTKFMEVVRFLNDYFDLVVVDTAPLLSVSDSSALMGMFDMNIAVCRHGKTKINELKQLISISEQLGSEFDGIVYNSYERPSSYYGYYGLYGNYNYQYYANKYLYESYEYKRDE